MQAVNQAGIEISIKGRNVRVPSLEMDGKRIVVTGKLPRIASVHDEEWLGGQIVTNPESVVRRLREANLKADIFTFSQKLPDQNPEYRHHFEWDNVAAIPLTSFEHWWDKLSQETRRNVRRSAKREVVVKSATLDDELIRGIVEVYNADPIRQGIPNLHYGKPFDTLKREVSTYSDVSEFIGAYYEEKLIGYIKMVYVGSTASIMNIVSIEAHQDKKPTNALLAKAVEIACQNGKSYLVYRKYTYGNKLDSPLTEFKRRNGFEKILLPRYYIPLTMRGRIVMFLRLHRGLLGILPSDAITVLVKLRSKIYGLRPSAR